VARIAREELMRTMRDGGATVRYERFDHHDGLQGSAQQLRPQPSLVEGLDGRLWFSTSGGLQWLDPQQLHRNQLAPPVTVKALRVGNRQYRDDHGVVSLPVRTSQVAIDYTAASLTIPERVAFRYRLDTVDDEWVEAGKRREANYANLKPGHYVFRVQAANEQGVWNTEGASVAFDIPPTLAQTRAFLVACGLLALGLIGWLYHFRMRRVAAQIQARLGERLSERERIARELHDTLLQGFQALVLHLHVANQHIPEGAPARQMIERALERADRVLGEGRDRVNGLRARSDRLNLVHELSAVGEQLAMDHPARYQVRVTGTARELHPVVAEEATRIGHEALVNAFRHAQASEINLGIAYGMRELRVSVRDDGVGIDVASHGSSGRWGLVGIRERAARIKAQVEIRTEPGAGTEVELRVPHRVAYWPNRARLWR
jgi:signal transduction histidine kinase